MTKHATGHLFITQELPEQVEGALADLPVPVVTHRGARPPTDRDVLTGARGAVAIVSTVNETIDDDVMRAAGPDLRIIANCAVGYDNIDLAAAAARGILVSNTPGVLDKATADVAFGLLLATARRIVEADRFVRSRADWHWGPGVFLGRDVSAGTTLGIVGLGRIGFEMARRAVAFDMKVLAYDRRPLDDRARALGVTAVDLDSLLAASDFVSLHCPLTPDTRHLINAESLGRMRPGSILINTARGPLVEEAALAAALRSGQLAAAGLDVFEDEPRIHPALLELENAVLLPHIASAGDRTRAAMATLAIENVRRCLAGRPLLTAVTDAAAS